MNAKCSHRRGFFAFLAAVGFQPALYLLVLVVSGGACKADTDESTPAAGTGSASAPAKSNFGAQLNDDLSGSAAAPTVTPLADHSALTLTLPWPPG